MLWPDSVGVFSYTNKKMKKQTIAVLLAVALLTAGVGLGNISAASGNTAMGSMPTASEREHLSMLIAEARAESGDVSIQMSPAGSELKIEITSPTIATSDWLQKQFGSTTSESNRVSLNSETLPSGVSLTFTCEDDDLLDELEARLRRAVAEVPTTF